MKADHERVITLAWQIENFGRTGKHLKNLDNYLNPPTQADRKHGMIEMFRRKLRKQEMTNGDR
ncbi:hypothetical protein [uncultured Novosphingobium sp.]|uniref:hypothetical protein n=1 Tax=uncultured Novosphingobium sp. TaxID=292277 RepID=UPI003747C9AF